MDPDVLLAQERHTDRQRAAWIAAREAGDPVQAERAKARYEAAEAQLNAMLDTLPLDPRF